MKRTFKNTIIFFLSLVLITNSLCAFSYADDTSSDYLTYTGKTDAYYNTFHPDCSFSIYSIRNNTFRGYFAASNLGTYDHAEFVSGSAYVDVDSITCVFSMNYYNSFFIITVYPYEGYARCLSSGTYHFVDFDMTGTKLVRKNSNLSLSPTSNGLEYNEYDFQMCLDLSVNAYGKKKVLTKLRNGYIPKDLLNTFQKYDIYNSTTVSKNYDDTNADNVSLSISHRNNPYNLESSNNLKTADMVVVIRGTTDDEWQGNTEITGTTYQNMRNHDNFDKAKENIKEDIYDYYTTLINDFDYDYVNLIITGHSRGAAVSNLYARDAIDKLDGFPNFNSVIAYTFATPNVTKYYSGMEDYNIYNFEIYEDLIPTVPLTAPSDGWNYWKYGKTFNISAKNLSSFYSYKKSALINSHAVGDVLYAFSKWKSIEEYYNKELNGFITSGINNNGQSVIIPKQTTLYKTLHDITGSSIMSESISRNEQAKLELRKNAAIYSDLFPLFTAAANNAISIKNAHHFDTYEGIMSDCDLEDFERYTYNDCINDEQFRLAVPSPIILNTNNRSHIEYNNAQKGNLIDFYNQTNYSDVLDWDITDPSTWTGITWNSSGNVTAIDLPYLDLEGTLNLSNFSALESVNLVGNKLTSINLTDCDTLINLNISANNLTLLDVSDCTDLEALDCSFNDLSNGGLDVSANTALTSLTCDDCGLTTLNVNDLTALEELSCAFNELTTINVENNTALTSLICCYNYLDTHEGGTLYNKFDDLLFSDVYVNYYPQAIPDNATFNTSELNALKTFALTENNNNALDWLDDNDNIDTDKLQNNVLFEYDGSAYRIVAVDIADTEVEGVLNLNALTKLKELYCENTSITSLNVNNCTALSVLSCNSCEISTLNLPSNASTKNTSLYKVSCEYNHIDTTIFTDSIVEYITFKAGSLLEYMDQKGDDSALEAILKFAETLNENDYTSVSFEKVSELIDIYQNYKNLQLTQTNIDEIVTEILTSINSLEPYLDLDISAPHGTFTVTYDNELQNGNTHSLLFGTPVTLTATADEGYTFDGWYEKVTQRKFFSNSTYTFKITTNMDLEARFVRTGDVTLTFTNDTGQVVAKIDKSVSEWSDVTDIADLLPEVPYKLGHTNGRWDYTETDVLTTLQAGNDVTITPIYDNSTYEYPTVPTPTDSVPVINLYYNLDADNNIGSFTMAAGIPQDLNIEAIGIGFYYKKAVNFNPSNFILNINNKMLTSRFDNTDSDGIYIVNINKFTSAYNWCARGYITYYDENNELKTVYSNQINIVNREQIV